MNSQLRIALFFLAISFVAAGWFDKNDDLDDDETTTQAIGIEKESTVPVHEWNSLDRSIKWILNQRTNHTWGEDIARVAIVLSLVDGSIIDEKHRILITKELSSEIMINLMHDPRTRLTSNRISLYIKALIATCQDPRNFLGKNLVKLLEDKQRNAAYNQPGIIHSLCLSYSEKRFETMKTLHDSTVRQMERKNVYGSRLYDFSAYIYLTMACLSAKLQTHQDYYLNEFNRTLHNFFREVKEADVYTEALMLQAVNAWSLKAGGNLRREKDQLTSSLIAKQKKDGSFGDFLSTYFALPAIAGKSLNNLYNISCTKKVDRYRALETEDQMISISISIWITREGGKVEKDTHTFSIQNRVNIIEAMDFVSKKNPFFKFEYEETNLGKAVYSIADVPNDGEKQMYWFLYLLDPRNPKDEVSVRASRNYFASGLEKIFVVDNFEYIFWYKY